MKSTDMVHIIAGIMIILSVSLSFLNSYWLILTTFIGLNLFQYGFTKFCPLEKIIIKLKKA